MLPRHAISDADWDRIKDLMPAARLHGGVAKDNRLFIDAVLYVGRTGILDDLPERFGKPNTVRRRLDRWAEAGRWDPILADARPGPRPADPRLDGRPQAPTLHGAKKWTAPRPGRAGPRPQPGRFRHQGPRELRRARHPVELILTAAQESDDAQAEGAVGADHEPEAVIADKGYDKKGLVEEVERRGPRR